MRTERLYGRNGTERIDKKMVGGRDTIDRNNIDVEKLLRCYNDRKYMAKVLEKKDEEIELLDKCLFTLSPCERELLLNLFVNNVSERDCVRLTGLTRYRVRKEKERLLGLTAAVFERFSSENN